MHELPSSLQVQPGYRNIVRLALPVAIAMLIPQFNILTNTIFLGYYRPTIAGPDTAGLLSASGIAGIFYLTLVMIGYGLSSGLLMLMSRRAGANDAVGLGRLFSNGWVLSLGLSLVLMLLSLWLAPVLFRYSIHDEAVREAAISFIQLRVWGLPFILLSQLSNSFFLATSRSRRIIWGTLAQTLVNICFDYLLIFGRGPFPESGLQGTAIASVLSEFAFMTVAYTLLHSLPGIEQYRIRYRAHFDPPLLRAIFLKSLPLIIQFFLSIGAWEVFFLFVEHLGRAESAVSQVLRTVFGVVGIAAWALGSTTNAMVSNLLGQHRPGEVWPLVKKIITLSLSIALCIGIWLLIFPEAFLRMLSSDAELIEVAIQPLRIVVVATWMLSVSTICFNAVLGTGNTRINMLIEFAGIGLYLLYCIVVIETLRLSLSWAWASEFVYWFSLFVLSMAYLKYGKWKHRETIEGVGMS